jgi:hypothetical protein
VRRIDCRRCGKVKRERLDFLADNPLYTKRFAYYVGRRCRDGTIKDVAAELGLDWHTVKALEMSFSFWGGDDVPSQPARAFDHNGARAAVPIHSARGDNKGGAAFHSGLRRSASGGGERAVALFHYGRSHRRRGPGGPAYSARS